MRVRYLSVGSRLCPPARSVEPRPVPPDGDPAPRRPAASAPAPPPGTATQYLSVWEQDVNVSGAALNLVPLKNSASAL